MDTLNRLRHWRRISQWNACLSSIGGVRVCTCGMGDDGRPLEDIVPIVVTDACLAEITLQLMDRDGRNLA